jgi:hypothetical protein
MSPNTNVRNIAGLNIPEHDHITVNYVGSTNNIFSVVYRRGGSGGQTVATITLTYVGGTPSSNDADIATVTRT